MRQQTSNYREVGTSLKPTSLSIGFLLALRATGRTQKTEETYRQALDQLEGFSRRMGMPSPEHMTAEHLREFFLSLYERGNRPGTVVVRYGALRSFYKWLLSEGERTDNPIDRIPAPRQEQRVMPHWTPSEVSALLITTRGRSALDVRDTAIIMLLYDTGLRAQELCNATLEGLDLKALTLRVRGKGHKERIVGVGYKAARSLERYLRQRRAESPWLFVARNGRQLTFNALRLTLERRCKQCGMRSKGLHAFRRGFAIAYLDSGGSPEDLRTLAGWDSVQMLRRYTKATETQRALHGHRAHSPGDRL